MTFERTVENFICEHCDAHVEGSGYTNHCPLCLWSKHVDVYPGDRAEPCGAMMEPVAIEGASPAYRVVHHCTKCGQMRRIGVSPYDSIDALVSLAQRIAAKDEDAK
ncbi:MAG TPA: RNHCP domain-containing protein [Candidatus Paceibacterota bacterium]